MHIRTNMHYFRHCLSFSGFFLHTFYTNKRKLLYILIYIFCHFLPASVGCEGADSPG